MTMEEELMMFWSLNDNNQETEEDSF